MKALKVIIFVWIFTLLNALAAFLLQLYLSRALGPAGFGKYSSVMAIVNIGTILVTLGSSSFLLRSFSQEGESGYRWVKPVYTYMLLQSILLAVAGVVACMLMVQSAWVILILLIYIYSFLFLELFLIRQRLEGRFYSFGLWQVVPNALRLALIIIIFLIFGASAENAYFALCIASLLMIFFMRATPSAFWSEKLDLNYRHTNYKYDKKPNLKNAVALSFPFGIMALSYSVYVSFPVYIIAKLNGEYHAGLFSAAITIILGIYTLPSTVFQKVLMPRIQYLLVSDLGRARRLYQRSKFVMLILGLVIGGCIILLSNEVIFIFFGAEYIEASVALKLLSACIPLRFLNSASGAFLNSESTAVYKSTVMLLSAVCSLFMTSILVMTYEYFYAAYMLIFIELLMVVLFSMRVNGLVFKSRGML